MKLRVRTSRKYHNRSKKRIKDKDKALKHKDSVPLRHEAEQKALSNHFLEESLSHLYAHTILKMGARLII